MERLWRIIGDRVCFVLTDVQGNDLSYSELPLIKVILSNRLRLSIRSSPSSEVVLA